MKWLDDLFSKGRTESEDAKLLIVANLPSPGRASASVVESVVESPPQAPPPGEVGSSLPPSPRDRWGGSSPSVVRKQISLTPTPAQRRPSKSSYPSQPSASLRSACGKTAAAATSVALAPRLDRELLSTLGRDAASMRLEHCNALRRM